MSTDLIKRAKQGDREAFTQLVQPHLAQVYRIAAMVLLDADLAKDAVQEALMRAHFAIRCFRGDEIGPWLRRFALNEAKRLYRRRKRQEELLTVPPHLPSQDPSPEDRVLADEARQNLIAALSVVSEKHRAVLVLRYVDDRSEKEIAKILGIRLGTVKSRLHNARKLMREQLTAEEKEPTTPQVQLKTTERRLQNAQRHSY